VGKGSLSFLGPKYEVTLAEVWERILDETKDSKYSEEELMVHFLNEDERIALASGKEKLAIERAALSGTELPETLIVHDSTASASTTDIVIASDLPSQSAKIPSAPVEGETQIAAEQASQEDKDESDDAQQFEIAARDPNLPGNVIDSVQEDFLLTPFEFEEFEAYLDHYLGLDALSSPFFVNDTDVTFSSLIAASLGAKEPTPPPADTSLVTEATPDQPSQPVPHSEVIPAMANIDDPVSSPEVGGDSDAEGGETTPEAIISQAGTESTHKKRKKLIIPRKPRPEKLQIKSSESSKGGKKKK